MTDASVTLMSNEDVRSIWAGIRPGSSMIIQERPVEVRFSRSISRVEGVEFCFSGVHEPSLASSAGFEVEVERTQDERRGERTILRLIRASQDEDDIFITFCSGLITLVQRLDDLDSAGLASEVCDYVAAWQAFMKTSGKKLSREKELGLFGELLLLEKWLRLHPGHQRLAEIWQGPRHAARDFVLAGGWAVEVKTSVKETPFIAKIDSLSQLDMTDFPKLCVAAVKVSESEEGRTVADLVRSINDLLVSNAMRRDFELLLLLAGFNAEKTGRPLVKYACDWIRLFSAATLPRLAPGMIPGIVRAAYDIALLDERGEAAAGAEELPLEETLNTIEMEKDDE